MLLKSAVSSGETVPQYIAIMRGCRATVAQVPKLRHERRAGGYDRVSVAAASVSSPAEFLPVFWHLPVWERRKSKTTYKIVSHYRNASFDECATCLAKMCCYLSCTSVST